MSTMAHQERPKFHIPMVLGDISGAISLDHCLNKTIDTLSSEASLPLLFPRLNL